MNSHTSRSKIIIILIVSALTAVAPVCLSFAQSTASAQTALEQKSVLEKLKESLNRLKSKMNNNNAKQKIRDNQLKLKQAQADARQKQDAARVAMERARARQQQNMQSLKSQLKQR